MNSQVVRKGTGGEDGYSGFSVRDPLTNAESDTAMEEILKRHGVTDVDVVGIATDYCVKETALDACRRGYQTNIYLDCMKGVNLQPGDADSAIAAMVEAGIEVFDS